MPIQRTAWIDDDGTGTTGTIINNAEKTKLYDQIDAALLNPLNKSAQTVVTSAVTGTVHNWAPGLAGNTTIMFYGSADLTITGIAGGIQGQLVTLKNNSGAVVYARHNDSGSSAGNRLYHPVTSAPLPIAAGGWASWIFDSGLWTLIAHEQGAWITPAYSAADYTATGGGWTVDAGDVDHCEFRLDGKLLTVRLAVFGSSVSSAPTALQRKIPGGFTASKAIYVGNVLCNNAGGALAVAGVSAAGNTAAFGITPTIAGGAWAASTNTTNVYGSVAVPVN